MFSAGHWDGLRVPGDQKTRTDIIISRNIHEGTKQMSHDYVGVVQGLRAVKSGDRTLEQLGWVSQRHSCCHSGLAVPCTRNNLCGNPPVVMTDGVRIGLLAIIGTGVFTAVSAVFSGESSTPFMILGSIDGNWFSLPLAV